MKRTTTIFRCLIALVLLAMSSVPALADEQYEELNFGIISTESSSGLKKGFSPFLDELAKKIGMKINAYFAPDYAGIIEAMRFNKVQFAWFGNKSAIEAVDRAGGEVFAQTTGEDGGVGYYSLIITHKDSPYNTVDELIANGKDLKFGNGDPNSTSGYLIPTYYIWSKKGIDPKALFQRTVNANHEANSIAVANKQVDFATNNTENMSMLEKSQPEMFHNIKILWKSPMIPSDPLVWRKDLPRELKSKIASAIFAFGRGDNAEKERKILAEISGGWGPFLVSDNRQLLPIRELKIAKDINKLENNKDIADSVRNERIAALKKEQERLVSYIELGSYWDSSK